jgi:hypothetical protein
MQFTSLSAKYQLNISETSADTSGISELSAEYQGNIRVVGCVSEEHQSIKPRAGEHQVRISK